MIKVTQATYEMYAEMYSELDVLGLMRKENRVLYDALMLASAALTDDEASTFLSGAMVTYNLLHNQSEADELEKAWKM